MDRNHSAEGRSRVGRLSAIAELPLLTLVFFVVAITSADLEKPASATGKKREVQTAIIPTSDHLNHDEVSQSSSRQRAAEAAGEKNGQKKDVAVHAAKRKKFTRNEKLVGSDGLDDTETAKPIPKTTEVITDTDRKSVVSTVSASPERSKTGQDRLSSPPIAVNTRDSADANKTDHVISEMAKRRDNVSITSPAKATATSSVVEKANDKDRADLLDNDLGEDDVADSFALFAPGKSISTSGADKMAAAEKLPVVSQPSAPPVSTSRTDSYDQLSSGGAAITMADSGYQTYDHDLSALDDRPTQVRMLFTIEDNLHNVNNNIEH